MVFPSLIRPNFKAFLTTVGISSLLVTGAIVGLRQMGFFEQAELEHYDQLLRRRPKQSTDQRVVVIGISETDIQSRKEYPIKDDTLAELLKKVESYEPKAIGVDIGRDVPQGTAKGRQQMLKTIQANDRIVMACVLSSSRDPGVPAPPGTPPEQIGFADLPTDRDSTVRRAALISTPDATSVQFGNKHSCNDASISNEVSSLAFALSLIYLEDFKPEPAGANNRDIRLGGAILQRIPQNIGGYVKADVPDFQIMLNYRSAQRAVQTVDMGDVLAGRIDSNLLKDKLVLIGYTSKIIRDTFKTPYQESQPGMREMYGVQVHAQVSSQILSTVLDGQKSITAWPKLLEIAYILLWAIAGGTVALYCRKIVPVILLGSLGLIISWGLAYALLLQAVWIPLVPVGWVFVSTFLAVGFVDRANRSGYAQAFYEQMQTQFLGQMQQAQASYSQQDDYLTNLVKRARTIRYQREGIELEEDKALSLGTDLLDFKFDTPEAQAIYGQMKRQWEEEWHSQVIETQTSQHAEAQEERITQILDRAKSVRTQLLPPPMANAQMVIPQIRNDLTQVLPERYRVRVIQPDTIYPENTERVEHIESNTKNSQELKQ
jgi:adenylate cyclase